eukprot:2279844-Pyramimonas_sp.AAC.1
MISAALGWGSPPARRPRARCKGLAREAAPSAIADGIQLLSVLPLDSAGASPPLLTPGLGSSVARPA